MKRHLERFRISLLVLLLVLSLCLGAQAAPLGESYRGYVATTGGDLNIWISPSLKGAKLGVLPYWEELVVQDYPGGVSRITDTAYPGDDDAIVGGYVGTQYVARMYEPDALPVGDFYQARVNTTGGELNLWASYTLTGKTYRAIANGTVLDCVQDYAGGYSLVWFDEHESAFVRTGFLVKIGPAVNVPPM